MGSRRWSPGLRAAVERAWGPFFGAMEQFDTLRLQVQEFKHAIHIPRTENRGSVWETRETQTRSVLSYVLLSVLVHPSTVVTVRWCEIRCLEHTFIYVKI